MKIAFWGNTCNNFFALCKILRDESSFFDCHLYLDINSDIQNLPESENVEFNNNYPSWIHKDIKWNPQRFFTHLDKSLLNELNKYDLVFLSGRGVSLIPYITKKSIFFVTGGDLTISPFFFRQFWGNISLDIIPKTIASFFQKKGIRNAFSIITQPFFPFVNALELIKVDKNKINRTYFPVVIDTSKIQNVVIDTSNKFVSEINLISRFKLKIFHPSRIMLKKNKISFNSGQWKNNGLLFEAVAQYKEKINADIILILIERDFSPDILTAKKIIENLNIEENVIWLKPQNPQGYTKNELLNFYSISDIVVDEFGVGWFGSVVLEGLACKKPVICKVDESIMKKIYPWHPILNAESVFEIVEIFEKIVNDKEFALKIGDSGLEWIQNFHSESFVKKLYAKEILNYLNFNEI